MCRLILVRHCCAAGQSPGDTLTSEGFRQADSLADFLSNTPIDAVFSSEYRRARQTAEPLARRLGLVPQFDARLNERHLADDPIANWREIVRDSFDDPDLAGPGGESARQVLHRAWGALRQILDSDHRLPMVVTHGNLMALVMHSLDAGFGFEGWENLTNPDVYALEDAGQGRLIFRRLWHTASWRR